MGCTSSSEKNQPQIQENQHTIATAQSTATRSEGHEPEHTIEQLTVADSPPMEVCPEPQQETDLAVIEDMSQAPMEPSTETQLIMEMGDASAQMLATVEKTDNVSEKSISRSEVVIAEKEQANSPIESSTCKRVADPGTSCCESKEQQDQKLVSIPVLLCPPLGETHEPIDSVLPYEWVAAVPRTHWETAARMDSIVAEGTNDMADDSVAECGAIEPSSAPVPFQYWKTTNDSTISEKFTKRQLPALPYQDISGCDTWCTPTNIEPHAPPVPTPRPGYRQCPPQLFDPMSYIPFGSTWAPQQVHSWAPGSVSATEDGADNDRLMLGGQRLFAHSTDNIYVAQADGSHESSQQTVDSEETVLCVEEHSTTYLHGPLDGGYSSLPYGEPDTDYSRDPYGSNQLW